MSLNQVLVNIFGGALLLLYGMRLAGEGMQSLAGGRLRQAHIQRLHAGLRESIETSSIHLDVLNDLKRINSHATNIAYVVLGEI